MKRDAGKEKFWREVVGEACGSGQTVREFCRQRGLKENLFYMWRRSPAVPRHGPTRSRLPSGCRRCWIRASTARVPNSRPLSSYPPPGSASS